MQNTKQATGIGARPQAVVATAASLGLLLSAAFLAGCGDHPPHGGEATDAHGHAVGAESAEHGAEHAEEVVLDVQAVARHGVETQRASLRELRPTIVAPARVGFDTEAMAHVGSPLRGRISEVNVRLGHAVRVGEVLAVIESPELGEAQTEYLQRRVAVQTAEPTVDLAKVAWDRARGLHERSQGISLTEVQRREAEYKAAVAALRAAEAARTAAANRLQLLGMDRASTEKLAETGDVDPHFAIRAAIDGIVVQREITMGELVGPDREYLMVLADATRSWVLAEVPEAELGRVRLGALAWVRVGSVAAAGQGRIEGRVTFLSPFVDATTRTAQVRIEVAGTERGLKPGMFAQAEISATGPDGSERIESVIAVPEEAVQTIEGSPAIFVPVLGRPGAYRKRNVSVGRAVAGMVPVHAGLGEGEEFVGAGTFILKAELAKGAASHEH